MFGGAWRNVTVMQRVCGVCLGPLPAGRVRLWCGDACRQAAFRARHGASVAVPTIPAKVALRPHTVYECGGCGVRVLGVQRCVDCGVFMTRLGLGGTCPGCDEAVTFDELLGL